VKPSIRILWAALLFVAVFSLSLYAIPQLGPLRDLERTHEWLRSSDITQISFLLFSLLFIWIWGGGRFREYGFRSASGAAIGRALFAGIGVSALLVFLSMVAMSILVGPEGMEDEGFVPRNTAKLIISVWIIASSCEEIFYRGLLQGFLSPLRERGIRLIRYQVSFPVIFAALTFGLGHFCLLSMLPPPLVLNIVICAAILGLVAGYHRERTGSLIPAILVHMTFNIVGWAIPQLLQSILPA
jgi:membrane protease YdiL (CAAX protease family)